MRLYNWLIVRLDFLDTSGVSENPGVLSILSIQLRPDGGQLGFVQQADTCQGQVQACALFE